MYPFKLPKVAIGNYRWRFVVMGDDLRVALLPLFTLARVNRDVSQELTGAVASQCRADFFGCLRYFSHQLGLSKADSFRVFFLHIIDRDVMPGGCPPASPLDAPAVGDFLLHMRIQHTARLEAAAVAGRLQWTPSRHAATASR